jgi:hypothetical protein
MCAQAHIQRTYSVTCIAQAHILKENSQTHMKISSRHCDLHERRTECMHISVSGKASFQYRERLHKNMHINVCVQEV